MRIGGLDIGSTGCKLTVFDDGGERLGQAYRDYPVKRQTGAHEIDVSAMMDSVRAVTMEIAGRFPDLAGIGVTSFGESFVMADERGEPLRPAMLYTDPRGREECGELCGKLGRQTIARITGLNPHEMYSISRMMWVKRHEPEIYARTRHIFLIEDYIVWQLTGKAQIDYSLATRTMAFDIRKLDWSREIFAAAGIDPGLMSRPVPVGTCAGTVSPEAAGRTGLSPECRIVSACHDQVAAAVGAGAFDGSLAVDGAGTVECLIPVYDSLPDVDVMVAGSYCIVPYILPGKYVTYAFSYTGGALIQWCIDTLGRKEKETAEKEGTSVYQLLEDACPGDQPTGLLVLPHFAGAATPHMDSGAKGAILGLRTETTLAEIYRACMEGVTYEMKLNHDALRDSGIRFTKLHATGGGAKSRVWMQMKADILNLPIVSMQVSHAGTVGCAMMTGIAIGAYRDLRDAADHMVREGETFLPRPEMHERYMAVYERYRKAYEAVRPLV